MTDCDKMAYVGVGNCGRLVACIVDSPALKKNVAKKIGQYIRWGLDVKHMSIEKVRSVDWCDKGGICDKCTKEDNGKD